MILTPFGCPESIRLKVCGPFLNPYILYMYQMLKIAIKGTN